MSKVKKIMVALDFSEYSNEIVNYAGRLAEELGAELIFVNVINQRDIDMIKQITIHIDKISVKGYIISRAGQALSLKLDNQRIEKDKTVHYYIDGKGKKLNVLIERRTETLTYALFDVGLFGSKSLGQLMARQIVFEMAEAGAFLRNRHPAADR